MSIVLRNCVKAALKIRTFQIAVKKIELKSYVYSTYDPYRKEGSLVNMLNTSTYLNHWCVVVFGSQTELRRDVRIPGDNFTPHPERE